MAAVTASDWLRSLAAEATPGPWWMSRVLLTGDATVRSRKGNRPVARITRPDREGLGTEVDSDARLIALAPDLAVLCADAIDALEFFTADRFVEVAVIESRTESARELLARFAALQPDNTEEGT